MVNRRCARPGCSGLSSATLAYDYGGRVAWLGLVSTEVDPNNHDLCDRHAERFSVPRGWELVDQRKVVPLPLFADAQAS